MKTYIVADKVRDLVVDNFAGGGGASTGIDLAMGRSVDIAINHDPLAIAMHRANHPDTEHYCESVWDIDPREAVRGRSVALAWFSPDCKHFSKAKGGKPVDKNIRGLAWVALRWAATVRPRVIMLENVEEFVDWGPLTRDGRPNPGQKGRTFKTFVNALRRQGYRVEWRQLRASDYGTPTIRKRLFLVARRDGLPIIWPQPTHGDPKGAAVKCGRLQPWRTAAEIIDWALPTPSIFERKRPLAENTLRRIARGIQRFVIENPRPFIVGDAIPVIAGVGGRAGQSRPRSVDEPLATVTAKADVVLVTPTLIQTGYGEREGQAPRAPGLDKPLGTVVAAGVKHALVAPVIARQFGNSVGHEATGPLGTVTAGGGGKSQLVAAFLAKHFGGHETPGAHLEEPAPTVTATDHNALTAAFLTKYHGPKSAEESRGALPSEPIRTVDTANRYSLVAAHIIKGRTGSTGSAVDGPVHTITSGQGSVRPAGAAHAMGLVASHLLKLRGTSRHGQPVDEPAPTITAGGLHVGEVRTFLLKYYGAGTGQTCQEPLHAVTSKHRFGLVTVEGEDYEIVDIGMRMLEPHELFAAQGFPGTYIIDRDEDGHRFSKAAQVAMCGNAVPPQLSEALVRANLPELCGDVGNEREAVLFP